MHAYLERLDAMYSHVWLNRDVMFKPYWLDVPANDENNNGGPNNNSSGGKSLKGKDENLEKLAKAPSAQVCSRATPPPGPRVTSSTC